MNFASISEARKRPWRTAATVLSFLVTLWLPAAVAMGRDAIRVDDVDADGGQRDVVVPVLLTNDAAIHGFSVALMFDPDVLTLQAAEPGTALEEIGAEFFNVRHDNVRGSLVIGSIFAYEGDPFETIELPASPETPHEIARLRFDVAVDAPAGPSVIEPTENVGSPPVSNAFSISGVTLRPELESGSVSVRNENFLRIQDASTAPGSQFSVFVAARHVQPLQGFQVSFVYDNSIFSFVDATLEGTLAQRRVAPAEIEFFVWQDVADYTETEGRASVGVVVDYTVPLEGQVIPPSPDEFQSITRCVLASAGDPELIGSSHQLTLHDDSEDLAAINNQFTILQQSFTPDFINGTVTFVDSLLFRRGDANTDGRTDISDGIAILFAQFRGNVDLTCLKAANSNGDDRIDISDGIYIFSYLFAGSLPPPPPFPTCGADDSDDEMTCESFPPCN